MLLPAGGNGTTALTLALFPGILSALTPSGKQELISLYKFNYISINYSVIDNELQPLNSKELTEAIALWMKAFF